MRDPGGRGEGLQGPLFPPQDVGLGLDHSILSSVSPECGGAWSQSFSGLCEIETYLLSFWPSGIFSGLLMTGLLSVTAAPDTRPPSVTTAAVAVARSISMDRESWPGPVGSNRETRVGRQEKVGPHSQALEDPNGRKETRTWPKESDF